MRLLPSGLRATLVRAKSTGDGKRREQLEVVVDVVAWIVQPGWLKAGWQLWAATDQRRDYFLGLPSAQLDGMRLAEAKYTDAVAMSRALLRHVRDSTGCPLLLKVPRPFGLSTRMELARRQPQHQSRK